MKCRYLQVLFLAVLLVGCVARDVRWVDVRVDDNEGSKFLVQEEYVHDPVHGWVPRLHVELSGQERVLYAGNVVTTIIVRSDGFVDTFWHAGSYLYAWFSFSRYDADGDLVDQPDWIGRFDPKGHFEVCADIGEYQDEGRSLMFDSVLSDTTFRFLRAHQAGERLAVENVTVSVQQCRPARLRSWLKAMREPVGPSPKASPPLPEATTHAEAAGG